MPPHNYKCPHRVPACGESIFAQRSPSCILAAQCGWRSNNIIIAWELAGSIELMSHPSPTETKSVFSQGSQVLSILGPPLPWPQLVTPGMSPCDKHASPGWQAASAVAGVSFMQQVAQGLWRLTETDFLSWGMWGHTHTLFPLLWRHDQRKAEWPSAGHWRRDNR